MSPTRFVTMSLRQTERVIASLLPSSLAYREPSARFHHRACELLTPLPPRSPPRLLTRPPPLFNLPPRPRRRHPTAQHVPCKPPSLATSSPTCNALTSSTQLPQGGWALRKKWILHPAHTGRWGLRGPNPGWLLVLHITTIRRVMSTVCPSFFY